MFVKICGTTSEEDALLAVAMGADAVGFVFAPSPRQIAPQLAGDIARRLPPEILTVGVFRNELPERVVETMHAAGLRAAQLHGGETPAQVKYVAKRVPVVFKAFSAGDPAIGTARDYGVAAVLIDNPRPGSGQVFDWSLAEDVPGEFRLVLAGGLTAQNVADAIAKVHPWGVDVVTGVEASPGRKDPRKLRDFVAAAKAAAPGDDPGDERSLAEASDGPDGRPYDWMERG